MNAATTETPLARKVAAICAAQSGLEGPLLPILHEVQAEFGHVPEGAVPVIADALNISRAEVHGVITFYHDFREEPGGRQTLRICRAEACKAVGGDALAEAAKARLGVDWHGTTANGALTLEPVYCLGLCACGPAAMLGRRVIGRVDAARLGALCAEAGA